MAAWWVNSAEAPAVNFLSPYPMGLFLLCVVSGAARSQDQPTQLVVTEGHYIGYVSVADALATLESKGLTAVPGSNGDASFVEPDSRTAWTFAGKDNPAYPSAVRYVYSRSGGELHAEVTVLCEAAASRCEKFKHEIRDSLAQLAKKMSGDPSAKCSVKEGTMKCGAESERKQTDQ